MKHLSTIILTGLVTVVSTIGMPLSAQAQAKVSSSSVARKMLVSAPASSTASSLKGKGHAVRSPFSQALAVAPPLSLPSAGWRAAAEASYPSIYGSMIYNYYCPLNF